MIETITCDSLMKVKLQEFTDTGWKITLITARRDNATGHISATITLKHKSSDKPIMKIKFFRGDVVDYRFAGDNNPNKNWRGRTAWLWFVKPRSMAESNEKQFEAHQEAFTRFRKRVTLEAVSRHSHADFSLFEKQNSFYHDKALGKSSKNLLKLNLKEFIKIVVKFPDHTSVDKPKYRNRNRAHR